VVPLGLRQDLALPFAGELAADMWMHIHVTHLPSTALLTEKAGMAWPRPVK
jgi:hypothetical protein